ncbi:hypothetical protein QUF61_01705 [Candidatus Venteria ishoeyi]|uniref:hypothetical protein n=1 Tax=Candidatus Venteria ishoeyi TaxID=1899563 RepID=UPI0025A671D2|nr:hypothetical protein [Candidatus Venteria ishoeyi]MDM8545188.1 hypothetical protein [Candidatus Venteria ishoeyi]
MKYSLLLICLGLFVHPVLAADTIALQGVSTIGEKKYAFISFQGKTFKRREGGTIGEWQIKKIAPRTVQIKSQNKPDMPLQELTLQSRMTEHTSKPVAKTKPAVPMPFGAKPAAKTSSATAPKFKPRTIADEDVPAGHHRVRTPFGDVLVKDAKK